MNITVIIPAYNEEAYIGHCLQSLRHQSVKAEEILVIDNNSTDKTVEIAKGFPEVTVISEKKQGMIYARNCGFNHAKGDVIARCDADCRPPPHWIARIHENTQKGHFDALTGPMAYYDVNEHTIHLVKMYFLMLKSLQKGKETLMGPNMIITRDIWEKVKNNVCLDDQKVHEDLDLALHIHQAQGHIKRDNHLIMYTSSRRIRNNPRSFFGEYPIRFLNTLLSHGEPIPMPKGVLKMFKTD